MVAVSLVGVVVVAAVVAAVLVPVHVAAQETVDPSHRRLARLRQRMGLPENSSTQTSTIISVNADTSVEFFTDCIVHVIAFPPSDEVATRDARASTEGQSLPPSLIVVGEPEPAVAVSTVREGTLLVMESDCVTVEGDTATGLVNVHAKRSPAQFYETERTFTATTDMGEKTHAVHQEFATPNSRDEEAIFGFGQFQNGLLNYNQVPLNLLQFNTEAIVPFWVSSTGYAVLHDNFYSQGHWNAATHQLTLHAASPLMLAANTTVTGNIPAADVAGSREVMLSFVSDTSFGTHSGYFNLTVGGVPCLEWGSLETNLPNEISCVAKGFAKQSDGSVNVTLEYSYSSPPPAPPTVWYRVPAGLNTLDIDIADAVSYYVITPPSDPSYENTTFDQLISGYRSLTGTAPLYRRSAFGFWQCKERYHTQEEIVGAATEFRQRQLPIDNIVQDWHYWGNLGWGPQWDPAIYPTPSKMVETIHALNISLMVSVWQKYDTTTPFFKTLDEMGLLINGTSWGDVYNPDAWPVIYNFSKEAMFDNRVDFLWLDATEPEFFPNANRTVYLGSGNRYMNPYSLLTTSMMASLHEADYGEERFFALTRSSFAGQQRTGAALWSGDIGASFDVLRRQVAASINFAASGLPFWANDIGGFFRPADQYTSPTYRELLVRWFQFGVFIPIYRVHGDESNTEYWNYGPQTEALILQATNLRYRLIPYIYSHAAQVTLSHATLQRALSFDFLDDAAVRGISDQFMLGRSLMVAPILTSAEASANRSVYLPHDKARAAHANWTDFITCSQYESGATIGVATADLSYIPIFVRPGTLLPLGPFLQYWNEKAADPLEIRIYPGADASFTLYEDDGVTQRYKRGERATITFQWLESYRKFIAESPIGSFPGMLKARTLNLVLVENGLGCGINPVPPTRSVQYTGQRLEVTFDDGQLE